ncbi:uncharacterized protein BDR25DRAFT_362031 [Lindgomyces ingoldianus]|uniref:Uncharacterized protein n=1 Tax=Lindgomyces ingoldianus TaxID=673940 RepID=A0ACB6QB14_9PLEO|nr:uncharacterized protein BDR25DRAFT_362031 [Lindgomyces ingoldianus]KAF2464102.1 hypothetical protein BDR25DRAFT_362031 [Lindgomyces ingoldianus]
MTGRRPLLPHRGSSCYAEATDGALQQPCAASSSTSRSAGAIDSGLRSRRPEASGGSALNGISWGKPPTPWPASNRGRWLVTEGAREARQARVECFMSFEKKLIGGSVSLAHSFGIAGAAIADGEWATVRCMVAGLDVRMGWLAGSHVPPPSSVQGESKIRHSCVPAVSLRKRGKRIRSSSMPPGEFIPARRVSGRLSLSSGEGPDEYDSMLLMIATVAGHSELIAMPFDSYIVHYLSSNSCPRADWPLPEMQSNANSLMISARLTRSGIGIPDSTAGPARPVQQQAQHVPPLRLLFLVV